MFFVVKINFFRIPSEFQTFSIQIQIRPDISLCFILGQIWTICKGNGQVAQSETCLATDVSLTADPGEPSLIPARSHTFVEIDHEKISTVIILPSAESFKKGCCQLQAKVCAWSTG